ncbi:MAG: ATP-binding cassette domain-containing protein [Actinomycetota bacterium]|nr:ATP-binding cassette domain-containing protein [Actinomycetota bacterium]
MAAAAIEVEGLTKYYGDLLAVDHISFEVEHGEFFGFLGPNGAGKTSTIRMLTNLIVPSEGKAEILGMPVSKRAIKVRERTGVVPEAPNVFAELTSFDNLLFTAELYGVPRRDRKRRTAEMLERFGLEDKAGVKAEELSLGLKRRLSIAMGLVHEPRVIFLDEPTSGLDVHSTVTIREELRRLNRDGVTMFYTTHNMFEANELCQRIAVINRGEIIAIDTPVRLKLAVKKSQAVEVAFNPPISEKDGEGMRSLRGVEAVRMAGGRVRINTPDPPGVLDMIYDFAREKGLRIMSINTMGPSLEDVFLEITEARE